MLPGRASTCSRLNRRQWWRLDWPSLRPGLNRLCRYPARTWHIWRCADSDRAPLPRGLLLATSSARRCIPGPTLSLSSSVARRPESITLARASTAQGPLASGRSGATSAVAVPGNLADMLRVVAATCGRNGARQADCGQQRGCKKPRSPFRSPGPTSIAVITACFTQAPFSAIRHHVPVRHQRS